MRTESDSALAEFYRSLNTEPDLHQLVQDRVRENLRLEFKTKKLSNVPELGNSDSWQFSRALSGFANSAGGVLVWGVVTDKEECASDLRPIAQVEDFYSRLKKSLLNAVLPMVDGVQMETIPCGTSDGSGFVKCLIPSSQRAPHRAMLADREYFKRSTEGFYRLEHFDLEDMFGRRPRSHLSLTTRFIGRGGISSAGITTFNLELLLSITNSGRGSASAPYLAVTVRPPYTVSRYGLDGNGREGLQRHPSSNSQRLVYGGVSGIVIHSGVTLDVAAVAVPINSEQLQRGAQIPNFSLEYQLAAEGARPLDGAIRLDVSDIWRGFRGVFPNESI